MDTRYKPTKRALHREIERVKEQRSRCRRVIALAMIACFALGAGVIVTTLARPVQVHGISMLPTLAAGDILLMDCTGKVPQYGDVVVLPMQEQRETQLVKRVIGLPGDEIWISDLGEVFRNGEQLSEPYVKAHSLQPCDIELPVTVPEGYIFIMGDNRPSSLDSRSRAVGMVPIKQVIGRVWSSGRMLAGQE